MHSSRMRTVRCSGRLGGCLSGGYLPRGGGCLPRGCLSRGYVCLGSVSAGGCLHRGVYLGVSALGVSAQGGCLPSIVSAQGGVCLAGVCLGGVCLGWGAYPGGCTPPPVDRMTDACENITFPQLLLRMVKMSVV